MLDVRTDDEHEVHMRYMTSMTGHTDPVTGYGFGRPYRWKFACRSSTFTLSDGRLLGFSVMVNKDNYVGLKLHSGSRFNRMPGLELYERVDTWNLSRPLIVMHGLPGGRLCVKQPALATMCLETGLFDCMIGIDRPGYGLSEPHSAGSIASFGRDVVELMKELFPYTSVRFGIIGWSGGAPYVAGVAADADFQYRLRGAVVLGGVPSLKEGGRRNRHHYSITRSSEHTLKSSMKAASLGSCMRGLHTWYYAKFIARGPCGVITHPKLFDQIVANNKGEPQRIIDAMIEQEIIKAHPNYTAKELALFSQNGGENHRAHSEEIVACFKYYGAAGMDKDCQLLVNEWDVDWNTVRKVRWGIAHGGSDDKVPISHGQWWEEKLPRAESLFLEGHGHKSLLTSREMFDLMRRVYDLQNYNCTIS